MTDDSPFAELPVARAVLAEGEREAVRHRDPEAGRAALAAMDTSIEGWLSGARASALLAYWSRLVRDALRAEAPILRPPADAVAAGWAAARRDPVSVAGDLSRLRLPRDSCWLESGTPDYDPDYRLGWLLVARNEGLSGIPFGLDRGRLSCSGVAATLPGEFRPADWMDAGSVVGAIQIHALDETGWLGPRAAHWYYQVSFLECLMAARATIGVG